MLPRAQLFHALSILLSFLVTASAFAQHSPVGQWEMSVKGRVNGYSTPGTAFVEFFEDGSLSGYALLRNASDVYELVGEWNQEGRRISGTLNASPDDGATEFAFVFGGSARAEKSISVRCTSDVGDVLSLSGRPLAEVPSMAGDYVGTFRQHGVTGIFEVTVSPPGGTGLLSEVTGFTRYGGESWEISGYVILNRRGAFVMAATSSSGSVINIGGTFRPGRQISASGTDLVDGSRISIRME
jgi:hypothetical protein